MLVYYVVTLVDAISYQIVHNTQARVTGRSRALTHCRMCAHHAAARSGTYDDDNRHLCPSAAAHGPPVTTSRAASKRIHDGGGRGG